MLAANGDVMDLNGQIIEAYVALQVFAGARVRFDGDDPPRRGHTHGGGQAELAHIRAYVDEGFPRLEIASDEINVLGMKMTVPPEPRGHGAGVEAHPVSGWEAEGDEAAQSGRPQCAGQQEPDLVRLLPEAIEELVESVQQAYSISAEQLAVCRF
jgi:hypothetical protein